MTSGYIFISGKMPNFASIPYQVATLSLLLNISRLGQKYHMSRYYTSQSMNYITGTGSGYPPTEYIRAWVC